MALSTPQRRLLRHVCLKRYTVTYEGYLGSFRPHASVSSVDSQVERGAVGVAHTSFRPSTAEALLAQGLIMKTQQQRDASSTLKPTEKGLAVFKSLGVRE